MHLGKLIFAVIMILVLLPLFGIIEWGTMGAIMATIISLVIIGAFGFVLVKSLTNKGNKIEH